MNLQIHSDGLGQPGTDFQSNVWRVPSSPSLEQSVWTTLYFYIADSFKVCCLLILLFASLQNLRRENEGLMAWLPEMIDAPAGVLAPSAENSGLLFGNPYSGEHPVRRFKLEFKKCTGWYPNAKSEYLGWDFCAHG